MAMISCRKCLQKVSDKVALCPNCGYPTNAGGGDKQKLIAEKERLLEQKTKALQNMLAIKKEPKAVFLKFLSKRILWIFGTMSVLLIILVSGIALTSKQTKQSQFEEEYKRRFHEVPGYNRHNDGVGRLDKATEHTNYIVEENCYELGYRYGFSATKAIYGIQTRPEDDFSIPETCRGRVETLNGIAAGTKAAHDSIKAK